MSSITRKRPLSPTTSSSINSKPTSLAKKARTTPDIRTLLSNKANSLQESRELPEFSGPTSLSINKNASNKNNTTTNNKSKSKPSSPQKSYLSTITAIDKKLKVLDKACAKHSPNKKYGINSDNYAQAMSSFLPAVEVLLEQGEDAQAPKLAFNLMLYLSEHAFADFDLGHSMSGYGDSEEEFNKMDDVMLDIIAQLESQQHGAGTFEKSGSTSQPTPESQCLKHRWDPSKDADVGDFKTGRPNKQQRGWMARQKAEWEKERMEQRRERRERDGADVLRVGLEQLREDRDWIAKFGLEGFFPRSIERLEGLLKV